MSKKIFYGWWIVLACFLISFYVGAVAFYGFTAFFAPIREEFGWSYTQISFAASIRGLEMGIFAPLIGFLVDRFGSRKILFFGIITVGLGLMLFSYTRSLTMFYSTFIILALGAGGCTSMVTMVAVANWFRKNVGMALGVMMSGWGASGLLVPFIVRLIDGYGWRTTLILLAAGMWIIGIPLSLVVRNTPEEYGLHPDGRPPEEPIQNSGNQDEGMEIGFTEALKKRSFWYLSVVEAIRMITFVAVVTHVMPYLSSQGVSRATAGLVAGAIPLFSILGRFGFGWLGDIFKKRHMMAAAFLLMALGLLAFSCVKVIWFIFLFLVLFSPGFGGSIVLRGSILREYFGRKTFGKTLGIVMGCASLGGIIGPTVAGWVFDTLGSYHLVWLAFCGLAGFAIVLTVRIR